MNVKTNQKIIRDLVLSGIINANAVGWSKWGWGGEERKRGEREISIS